MFLEIGLVLVMAYVATQIKWNELIDNEPDKILE